MTQLFYGRIKNDSILFENENDFSMFLAANQSRKVYVEVGFETRQRTLPQNNSLHLGCHMLAESLNDAGLGQREILPASFYIEWDKDSVKKKLIHPIIKAKYGKSSTTELTKDEVSETWDVLIRELGEKFGVEYINFPSKETQNK